MHHGLPHRTARRSAPGGRSALLVAPAAGAPPVLGQHRVARAGDRRHAAPVPQRRAPREPHRTMHLLMSGLGALIMIGVCGLSAFFVVADERHARSSTRAGVVSPSPVAVRDLSSQTADPRSLTTTEVFPQARITMVPGASPYRLRMRNIDSDCTIATTGALGDLLVRHGCSQVVRATLIAPVEGYPVTAGIFNLRDEAAAATAGREVEEQVGGGDGSFSGMAVDDMTRPLESSSAQVGWLTRGHYLIYCVIARPDGRIVLDDDPYAERIVFDLVESYLREDVLGRRAAVTA